MVTDVNRTFAKLERRTERIAAVVRLQSLLVLVLVFWSLGVLESRHAAAVPLGGFAMITVAGLVTARRSQFHPWIPWLLASLDVMLLVHCLVDLALATRQPLHLVLDTPVALLIFVFLAAAAVRHRPFLLVYTGGLFVLLWIAILLVTPFVGVGSWSSAAFTAALGRLAFVGLVTFALFVAVTRARRTLTRSLVEARLRGDLSRYFSPQLVDEIANASSAQHVPVAQLDWRARN